MFKTMLRKESVTSTNAYESLGPLSRKTTSPLTAPSFCSQHSAKVTAAMSPEQNDGFSHEGDDIADVDKQPCYLLELAPELRNRIYEDVLVENKRVPINKGLRPPALLHTCKQVRDEATKL
ncbi:hypothetical protein HII31_05945 [Pseudocercospora fuligena]|uniref:Uncharacterized protein n=1 Tax=Pseudocercospora fuligena TaxID=685502 RepID=A0A8H6VLQ2_9PEZI|nr:hypothetical protein HII31_05945 [Pseudocercospora fuligena]